jgi:ATP-binding cassette subfamily C protein
MGRRRGRIHNEFSAVVLIVAPIRRSLAMALACTAATNLLALSAPLYMLELYDIVLPSRSLTRLALLTLALIVLCALAGFIDLARQRLLARAARRLDIRLARRIADVHDDTLLRDVDRMRSFVCGQGPAALFDLPWLPLYLAALFMLHPLLGLYAIAGAALLFAPVIAAERKAAPHAGDMALSGARLGAFVASAACAAPSARAMGFSARLARRWRALYSRHARLLTSDAHLAAAIAAAIRACRTMLQSGILGLGTYLVIAEQTSAASIFAASVILARALAPDEATIAHWRGINAARESVVRLARLPAASAARCRGPRARPRFRLDVERLSVTPPGVRSPIVQDVSFTLTAGMGLGIIGASGSGRSALARALAGIWPADGHRCIQLDGQPIEEWDAADLGRHIGYLPQRAELIDGTVADNIARFDPHASRASLIAAARAAGAHDLIARLPSGYETMIASALLSDGQRQRIAIARALFGEPFLMVLDEPSAHLDAVGEAALRSAIAAVRARGGIVIVATQRRSLLLGLDRLIVLRAGRAAAYGPMEEVMLGSERARVEPSEQATADAL